MEDIDKIKEISDDVIEKTGSLVKWINQKRKLKSFY